jgi:hypothetical protein
MGEESRALVGMSLVSTHTRTHTCTHRHTHTHMAIHDASYMLEQDDLCLRNLDPHLFIMCFDICLGIVVAHVGCILGCVC